MAPRPPTSYLRRRPADPNLPLPRRVPRPPQPAAFPVLPALAAALVLLAAAQLALWWWEARLPAVPPRSARFSNPFIALVPDPRNPRGTVRDAIRLGATTLPQNVSFGDALGRVTVTVFTDPSCGPCREQVRSWTAGLPVQSVRQVYKFWPRDPARLTPGVLVELARRQNVVLPMWRNLQGAGNADLDDGQLLTMLDRAGISLAQQRLVLAQEGASLTAALEPDITLAKRASLPPPPVVMVDDYVLDGEVLRPDNLNVYVKRRLEGRQIFERDELFLMRR